ncbi:uncharacterized protein LOC34618883 [Cyclospora cayetanensis]|uniref:Uncharacterized protein LOC34618883 n=1 Tax=Cyclospora cayetanensis TaxID=88456 RepID=A0A6P6RZD0_9EIME|nr:uncharacterized protein LOC34618883 [Cyclospora cayetanensis]
MDAEVSARLHCSLHFALENRLLSAALGICNRGDFYEAQGEFSIWRIVALAMDFRFKSALELLERLVEKYQQQGGLPHLPLRELRLSLLDLWAKSEYAEHSPTSHDFLPLDCIRLHLIFVLADTSLLQEPAALQATYCCYKCRQTDGSPPQKSTSTTTTSSAFGLEDDKSRLIMASALMHFGDLPKAAGILEVIKNTGQCCTALHDPTAAQGVPSQSTHTAATKIRIYYKWLQAVMRNSSYAYSQEVQDDTEERLCVKGWLNLAVHDCNEKDAPKQQALVAAERCFYLAQQKGLCSRKGTAAPRTFLGIAEALDILTDLGSREPWLAGAQLQQAVLLLSVSRWGEAAAAAAAAAAPKMSGGQSEVQQPAALLLTLIRLCSGGTEAKEEPCRASPLRSLADSFNSDVRYIPESPRHSTLVGFLGILPHGPLQCELWSVSRRPTYECDQEPPGFHFALEVSKALCGCMSWLYTDRHGCATHHRNEDIVEATLAVVRAGGLSLKALSEAEEGWSDHAAAIFRAYSEEGAWQLLLAGKPVEAEGEFSDLADAVSIPQQKQVALEGATLALLLQAKDKEATERLKQAESLSVSASRKAQQSPGTSALLVAATKWRAQLQDACGFRLYAALNPNFWLIISARVLNTVAVAMAGNAPTKDRWQRLPGFFSATEPLTASKLQEHSAVTELLNIVREILQTLLQHVPAHHDARVLLARTLLLRGELHRCSELLSAYDNEGFSQTPKTLLLLVHARCLSLAGKPKLGLDKVQAAHAEVSLAICSGYNLPVCVLAPVGSTVVRGLLHLFLVPVAKLEAQAGVSANSLTTLEQALGCCCLAIAAKGHISNELPREGSPSGERRDRICRCNECAARSKTVARGILGLSPLPLHCTICERLSAQLLKVELLGQAKRKEEGQALLESVAAEFGFPSGLCSSDPAGGSSQSDSTKCENDKKDGEGEAWVKDQILLVAAQHAARSDDAQRALELLSLIGRDSPSSAEAHIARAEVYKDLLADDAAAVRSLRRVVLQLHLSGSAALRAGELLLKLQHPKDASIAFVKALALHPDNREIVLQLRGARLMCAPIAVSSLRAAHYFEEAATRAHNELQKQPSDWLLLLQLVELLHMLGRHRAALKATAPLSHQEAITGKGSELLTKLRILLVKAASLAAASAQPQTAVGDDSEQLNAISLLRRLQSKVLALLADSEGRTAPVTNRRDTLRRLSASNQRRSSEVPGAKQQLLCDVSKQLIKLLWQRQKNPTAAEIVCNEALHYNAADVELHELRCRVSLQLGRTQEAEQAIRDIREIEPNNPAVAELQVQLIAAALPQDPQCLTDIVSHALQLVRQPRISFAAVEGALLLLRRRGLLDDCEEVCARLRQKPRNEQQDQQCQPQRQNHEEQHSSLGEKPFGACGFNRWRCRPTVAMQMFAAARDRLEFRERCMQQLLELLLRPYGFLDSDWMQQVSVRRRIAAFFSNAAAGFDSAVAAAATAAEVLVSHPWEGKDHNQLKELLRLPAAAAHQNAEATPQMHSTSVIVAAANELLAFWEKGLGASPDPTQQYKLQLYRCELALLSRCRADAEAALQQVKQLLQSLEQQQLHQPQMHALFVAAEAYIVLRQPERARATLQQAIDMQKNYTAAEAPNPIDHAEESARAQLLLAELLLADRQLDAAATAVSQAVCTLGPTYKASELLAKIAQKQKKHADAMAHLAEARTLHPHHHQVMLRLAMLHLQQQQPLHALSICNCQAKGISNLGQTACAAYPRQCLAGLCAYKKCMLALVNAVAMNLAERRWISQQGMRQPVLRTPVLLLQNKIKSGTTTSALEMTA